MSRFRIIFFDSKPYWEKVFEDINNAIFQLQFDFKFIQEKLTLDTVSLAKGFPAICCFVRDDLASPEVLKSLCTFGTKLILMRCSGFDNVDTRACTQLGISITRVPSYSPMSVAEHATALMLALNRKLTQVNARVHKHNFSLDGLVGFEMFGKTVCIIGTGAVGTCLAKIMLGFGCRVLCYDIIKNKEIEKLHEEGQNIGYIRDQHTILREADILSLHLPLTDQTRHIINYKSLTQMKPSALLINASRGDLVCTADLLDALKERRIGGAGLDAIEAENLHIFEDYSNKPNAPMNDTLVQLLTFENVILSGHMAFLTNEALAKIAETTLKNAVGFVKGKRFAQISNSLNEE